MSESAAPRRRSIWRLLTNEHRFGVFTAGAALSNIGTWCQNVAAILLVFRVTGDPALVALVSIAQYSPVLVLGPYAGVIADQFDRRTVLVLCQLGGVAGSTALAAFSFAGEPPLAAVLAIVASLGAFQAFQGPSNLSITPELAEPDERDLALSMNLMQFNLARVIGPVVATALIAGPGVAWAFVFNAVSYLTFLAALALIRLRPRPKPAKRPTLIEGFRVLRGGPLLIMLLLVGLAVSGATDAVNTLGPAISVRLHGDDRATGYFIAAFGAGAVLMAFIGVPLLRRARSQLVPLILVEAVGLAGFVLAPNVALAVLSSFVFGAAFLGANNRALTLLQEAVDPTVLGRITALWVVVMVGGRVLFAGLEGLVTWLASPVVAGVAVALLLLVVAIIFFMMRGRMRRSTSG